MVTLFIIGLCLYLHGFYRTLFFYFAIVMTVITLILAMVSGGGLSFIFFQDQTHAFQIFGELWTEDFVHRPGFTLGQGLLIPLIFFADLLRITVTFIWQAPNIFSIGAFVLWLWIMFNLWTPVWFLIGDNIKDAATTIYRFITSFPSLYKNARSERRAVEQSQKKLPL